MFNKKNDPLVESVKAVMKQNEVHRQIEAALNEELGISSKRALPHEYHAQYDALLEAKVVDAAEKMAKSLSSRVRNAIDNITGNKGGPSKAKKMEDPYEEQKKREIPEEASVKRKHSYMGEANIKHPNQQKLDVHEPKKDELTAKDFNKLRQLRKRRIMAREGIEIVDDEPKNVQQVKRVATSSVTPDGQEYDGSLTKDEGKPLTKTINDIGISRFPPTNRGAKMGGQFKPMDEAEGDVDPSTMTSISKGLQGRIVKDPPSPAPAPKKMNEDGKDARSRAARDLANQMYGSLRDKTKGTEDPNKPADPEKFENELDTGLAKRKAQIRNYMAKSVIAEIRENLEANLMAIHESGDDELFENYVNSLTEEELDILGLSEDVPSPTRTVPTMFGLGSKQVPDSSDNRNELASSPKNPNNPNRDQYGPPKPMNDLGQHRDKNPGIGTVGPVASRGDTDMGSYTDKQIPKTQDTDMDGYKPSQIPKTPAPNAPTAAQARPAPTAAPERERSPFGDTTSGGDLSGGGRDAGYRTPSSVAAAQARTAPAARPPAARPARSAPAGRDPFTMSEQVKPNDNRSLQIKESLESFLRNRFLKG